MAFYHVYLAVENVSMTAAQWEAFRAYFLTLGVKNNRPQDAIQLGRVRNDGQAYIAEALFDETTINQQAFERELARIIGVQQNRISAATTNTSYSAGTTTLVQTYTNTAPSPDVAVMRVHVFGGWPINEAASLTECLSYLSVNADAWRTPIPSPTGR